MPLSMRIAVVGSGGVGGYFGGRLAAAGADVTFLARGAHLEAMRTHGLRIQSPKGNVHLANRRPTADPVGDRAGRHRLFRRQALRHRAARSRCCRRSSAPTPSSSRFQNGVDSVARLTDAVGPRHAAGGTCYVSAVIAEPGVIKHTAMDHLIFGELDGRRTPRLEALLDACRPAGFQSTLSSDINVDIWTKFVRLSVLSGLTTVTRSPLGVVCNDPQLFAMLKDAVREAMNVAHAKGINVPATSVDDVAAAYTALPPQTKSSMLEDLERGRRLELPWLSGAVVRIAREVGVETPIHRFITAVLGPYVSGQPEQRIQNLPV